MRTLSFRVERIVFGKGLNTMRLTMAAGALLLLVVSVDLLTVVSAADETGTITGVVNHASVSRAPTVVYIDEMPGRSFTPPKAAPVIDQKNKAFLPKVLPVLVGTTVDFLNSDSFEHNVNSPDGEKYDLGKPQKGEKKSYTFKRAGVYTQLCNLHPEMIGYVVVLKTPYFAVADQSGKFLIPNVPAGAWKLKVWNERLRPAQLEKAVDAKVVAGQEVKVDTTP